MRLVNFKVAYLPDSDNIMKAVPCAINVEYVSLVLQLEDDVAGARTSILVNGVFVHVPEDYDQVVKMLSNTAPEQVAGVDPH